LAGCGGDGDEEGAVPGPAPPEHTEAEVLEQANIVTRDGGLSYVHKPSGCHLAVVMIGRDLVDLYADAGDVVASNPDRTVGVKISESAERDPECHAALTEALADL
jgi:hypothetical protein